MLSRITSKHCDQTDSAVAELKLPYLLLTDNNTIYRTIREIDVWIAF